MFNFELVMAVCGAWVLIGFAVTLFMGIGSMLGDFVLNRFIKRKDVKENET